MPSLRENAFREATRAQCPPKFIGVPYLPNARASLCLSLHITPATTTRRRRRKLYLSCPQTAAWNSHISSVIMSPTSSSPGLPPLRHPRSMRRQLLELLFSRRTRGESHIITDTRRRTNLFEHRPRRW